MMFYKRIFLSLREALSGCKVTNFSRNPITFRGVFSRACPDLSPKVLQSLRECFTNSACEPTFAIDSLELVLYGTSLRERSTLRTGPKWGQTYLRCWLLNKKTARRTKGYLMKCFTSRYISSKGKYRTAKLRKKSDISALSGPKSFGVIPILCRLGNRCFTIHFGAFL